jgi:hypothetical protein
MAELLGCSPELEEALNGGARRGQGLGFAGVRGKRNRERDGREGGEGERGTVAGGLIPLSRRSSVACISSQGSGDGQPSTELLAAREEDDRELSWAGLLLGFGWKGKKGRWARFGPNKEGFSFFSKSLF